MRFSFFRKKERIHLDYAATTPVRESVRDAMMPYFCDVCANPSALYREGVEARNVIESHRTELVRTLHMRPQDVTFTSGGTESNNLALGGVVDCLYSEGRSYSDMEIISTRIEHPSILETLKHLEMRGVRISYAPIGTDGLVVMKGFENLLNEKTVLVSIGYVNSEIGVVQDIKKVTRMVRAWNTEHSAHILTHTDACQAPLWLPCELDSLGVDLLSLDAGKCYGPKGVGVLVHRQTAKLLPVSYGGGQEGGLRSGTENTPLVVGCVRALVEAQSGWRARSEATASLRARFVELLTSAISGVVVNGSLTSRVANNVNISIPGVDTEYATLWLDARGVAVSTKSACGGAGGDGSYVVREISGDPARALSTLRFTLGEETTENELKKVVQLLAEYVSMMRVFNSTHHE